MILLICDVTTRYYEVSTVGRNWNIAWHFSRQTDKKEPWKTLYVKPRNLSLCPAHVFHKRLYRTILATNPLPAQTEEAAEIQHHSSAGSHSASVYTHTHTHLFILCIPNGEIHLQKGPLVGASCGFLIFFSSPLPPQPTNRLDSLGPKESQAELNCVF